jgi:hypothetical protein
LPGEASTTGANLGLDAMTGRVAIAARTTYLALLTAAPTDATTPATMVEVIAAGYARQSIAFSAPTGDPSATSNTATRTFGPFTADPPPVTHCALVTSASGTTGDLTFWWVANATIDAGINDTIEVAVGALVAQLD